MKTTIITLALTCIFSVSNIFASKTGNDVIQTVQKKITYPEFAIQSNTQGEVLVNFSIDEKGKTVINSTTYESEELGQYVTQEIQKIDFSKDPENFGKTFNLKFRFKLL